MAGVAGGVLALEDQFAISHQAHQADMTGAFKARFASDVAAQAAQLATGVVPYAANGPMIPVQAARLAPRGAAYELAGEVGGRWRVLAASDPKRVGQAPSSDLLAGTGGRYHDTAGTTLRYTAFHRVTMLPPAPTGRAATGPGGAPPAPAAKPKAQPSAAPALTHRVKYGETLFKISREHFGNDHHFDEIYQLNRAAIGSDRANLPVGALLKLPSGAHAAASPASPAPAKAAAPTPAPSAPPAPERPRQLALALTMTTQAPAASAPASAPMPALPLAGGAAGATGLLWLLGGVLLAGKRCRRLEQQRTRFLGGLDGRMNARGAAFDPTALRSPWRIEQASTVLGAIEPGGSYADVQALSDTKLGLFVGDATGSPANAVLSRGLAVAAWRAKASVVATPSETFLALNRLLADFMPQGDHVTAFYAQVDLLSGAIAFAAAAHPGAYVIGADGKLTMLGGRGIPLGIGQELFASRLEGGIGRLKEGEALWIYTDGLVKAENPQGEPFGLERLEKSLRAGSGWEPARLVAHVEEAVRSFVGKRGLQDDAAMFCLRLAPGAVEIGRVGSGAGTATVAPDAD
jgi:hypothetical protein